MRRQQPLDLEAFVFALPACLGKEAPPLFRRPIQRGVKEILHTRRLRLIHRPRAPRCVTGGVPKARLAPELRLDLPGDWRFGEREARTMIASLASGR